MSYNMGVLRPVYAIAGLGAGEIILLLIVGFFFAFLGLIIILIHSSMKRQDFKQQTGLPSAVAINIAVPNSVANDKKDVTPENTLIRNVLNEKIALPQQQEIRYVFVNEVLRCEADDNYTNFYLTNGDKILISKPLKEYSDLLKPHGFLRTHQSHLINPLFVKSWLKEDGGVLLMKNDVKVPVSKPNRESVKLLLGATFKSYV